MNRKSKIIDLTSQGKSRKEIAETIFCAENHITNVRIDCGISRKKKVKRNFMQAVELSELTP
jgi:hypothetical protein